MFLFLIPLVIGFVFNLASALTTAFSRRWGDRRGSLITMILRNILGIPVWAIGFGLAARTQSQLLFSKMIVTDVIGLLIIMAGGLIILIALVAIRLRAVAPSTRDHLVRNSLYAQVRHPIHTGAFLEFAGLFLLKPTQSIAIACVLGVIWVLIQTRLEEYDLLQRLPNYREYMNQVPRFLPRLRRN
jgi:protein-S-isoprenylcysteine O-methyltransferase Ste14